MTNRREVLSSDIRANWRDILAHVVSGGEVVVVHYNRPVAIISPYQEDTIYTSDDLVGRRLADALASGADIAEICGIATAQRTPVSTEDGITAVMWLGDYSRPSGQADTSHVEHDLCAEVLGVPMVAALTEPVDYARHVQWTWADRPVRVVGVTDLAAALDALIATGRAYRQWRDERHAAEVAIRADLAAAVEAQARVADVPAGAERWAAQRKADSRLGAVVVRALRDGLVARSELAALPGMHENRLITLEIESQEE